MAAIRTQKVEATTGFEPVNRGFADLPATLAARETALLHKPSAYSDRLGPVERSVDHARWPESSCALHSAEAAA